MGWIAKALGWFTGGTGTAVLVAAALTAGGVLLWQYNSALRDQGAAEARYEAEQGKTAALLASIQHMQDWTARNQAIARERDQQISRLRQEVRNAAQTARSVADPSGCADAVVPDAVLDRLR